jgi:acetyl-CoA carboxylase beta subunit
VIEQTIRQKLPEGFQRSEFLLDHGMLDLVVDRRELKGTLARSLRFMGCCAVKTKESGDLSETDATSEPAEPQVRMP